MFGYGEDYCVYLWYLFISVCIKGFKVKEERDSKVFEQIKTCQRLDIFFLILNIG